MPKEIRVVGQKFFYQLKNGNTFSDNLGDFTEHLKGNVLEKVKAVFNVKISWYEVFAKDTLSYFIDTTNNIIVIKSDDADFINNGFSVGDEFKFSTNYRVEGTINAISKNEISATITSNTNPNTNSWQTNPSNTFLTGLTKKTALEYKFGLIENSESFNTRSKLTNTDQVFTLEGIDHSKPLPSNPNEYAIGQSKGNNKAWQTGSLKCAFVGYSFDNDKRNTEDTTQEFQIEHEFIINPFYRDGEIDSLEGTEAAPIDLFKGERSLKYVFQTEFRTTVNNPNTSMISEYDTQLGSVGYFDESYNGYESIYSVDSLAYTVGGKPASKIESSSLTDVSFVLNGANFTQDTYLIIGHASIVDSEKYSFSKNEFNTIWNNEVIRVKATELLSSDIIKNLSFTYSANTLTVSFSIDLTTKITEDNQDYILYYTVENESLTAENSGKVTGRIDVNQYYKNSDISGLWNTQIFEQYPHAEPYNKLVTRGFTNAKGFNESSYFLDAFYSKDNTAELTDLSFEFIVFNKVTQEIFTLRSYDFNLSSSFYVGDIQNIELNSNRGYILKPTDLMDVVNVETLNSAVGFTEYHIQVGYKTPWQDWVNWKNAPSDFYDKTKSNNGLNDKSSEYSLNLADFEPRVILKANLLKDGVTTEYITSSEGFEVYDYETDDQLPDAFSGTIKTFKYDEDGVSKVEINGNIIEKDFTEVRAEFVPVNPPVFSEDVDMSVVATTWNRFAFGNLVAAPFSVNRLGVWANEQADSNDEFRSVGGVYFKKADSSLYTSLPESILSTENCGAFYGCSSIDAYEYYEISGKMYSNAVDNDALAYLIAHHVDEDGIEHTLSLVATTGGVGLTLNPTYEKGNTQTEVYSFVNTVAKWAIVYDYGKSTWQNILEYETTKSGLNWSDVKVGDLGFEVKRSSDDIQVDTNWTIDGVDFSNVFNFNLSDYEFLAKFKGFSPIGFGFHSQDQGGFKEVKLTKPNSDYYGIIRIEPKDSSTDFAINELSTENEAPEVNLLKQSTGDEKKAILQWDGSKFVIQGQIETNNVIDGEGYRFSAELRSKNLTE